MSLIFEGREQITHDGYIVKNPHRVGFYKQEPEEETNELDDNILPGAKIATPNMSASYVMYQSTTSLNKNGLRNSQSMKDTKRDEVGETRSSKREDNASPKNPGEEEKASESENKEKAGSEALHEKKSASEAHKPQENPAAKEKPKEVQHAPEQPKPWASLE